MKTHTNFIKYPFLLLFACIFCTCENKEDSLTGIYLDTDQRSIQIKVGEKIQIRAYSIPFELKLNETNFNWSSANSSIATVSAIGLAEGVAEGTTKIIVDKGDVSATIAVLVRNPVLTAIAVDSTSVSIEIGKSAQLTATPVPADAVMDGEFTWTSGNSSIASVFNGYVEGVGMGTTNIIVSYGTISKEIPVTVTGMLVKTNILLNKPYTVSDELSSSYPGSNAIDGIITLDVGTSRWVANSAVDHWLEIDLQGEYTIVGFKIWGDVSYPVKEFAIQAWVNGGWVDAWRNANFNGPQVFAADFSAGITTEKVRYFAPYASYNLGVRLFEWEVYAYVNQP
jgi:hypothetical protein